MVGGPLDGLCSHGNWMLSLLEAGSTVAGTNFLSSLRSDEFYFR